MNYQSRIERLQRMVSNNQILRGKWTEGNERACLLAALSPEAGEKQSATACPASVMPQWLSNLTPSMDDNGTETEWPAFIRRYAAVAARWHVLSAEDWRRADHAVRALSVREAMKHTQDKNVLDVCGTVASLNEKAAKGGQVDPAARSAAWSAARSAAWSAARSAARSAAESAANAANAAESAANAAESAANAANAAESAAESVAWSAARRAAWSAARSAANAANAANAAWSAAWDRINDGILTILENACTAAEAA